MSNVVLFGKVKKLCLIIIVISSLASDDASLFAKGIRGHWSIENRLHWVKDVIQYEDDSGIKKGNGIEAIVNFKKCGDQCQP